MQKQLPIYNVTVNPDSNDPTGMYLVSLVEEPAIEVDFMAFNKQERMEFQSIDPMKHMITGPAILADTPIYRWNGKEEYYVVFRKEDIVSIVEKFMRNNFSNLINLQHESETLTDQQAIMIESFFVNKEGGILPAAFAGIPDGSWMVTYKITDEDLWQKILAGEFKGFSIEIHGLLVEEDIRPADEDQELIDNIK